MNKDQMLNGMSEEEFYNLYPTEEDYVMAMGGQAGNDDFYVPHQDADRLRASTPINFINTPYYNLGGPSDGPLGYFGDGGGQTQFPYLFGVPPQMQEGGSNQNDQKIIDKYSFMFSPDERDNSDKSGYGYDNLRTKMEKEEGLGMEDSARLAQYIAEGLVNRNFPNRNFAKAEEDWDLPDYNKSPQELDLYTGNEDRANIRKYRPNAKLEAQQPFGYGMEDGVFQFGGNPSPMNYGAFPVMAGGGEFTMIINDLLQKQFGGVDTKNQAPSTDGILENNRNFFNSYIRNNVGKALAEEMKNDFQQQMMAGTYMQNGGPFSNSYTGVNGSNEELTYQMQNGGEAMDRADVNARTTECSPIEKMDPTSQCYDPNYFDQGAAQNTQQSMFDYSTPQGSFDAQGNQTADAYGKMPETPSPYFSSQPPSYGQELVGATPQQDVGTWDMNNPNAPQAPKVQTWDMDPNQTRTQEPTDKTKGNSKYAYNWQQFIPNGMDVANKMLGTMDFITNRLEARENKKQEKENAWRYSGDAVLEARPEMSSSRGDYSKNSGRFRPDQYVPVQFPGTNYGNVGTNQYAQMGGGFNEGEDVYMSDEDIQQYLAAGGQLEILD